MQLQVPLLRKPLFQKWNFSAFIPAAKRAKFSLTRLRLLQRGWSFWRPRRYLGDSRPAPAKGMKRQDAFGSEFEKDFRSGSHMPIQLTH